MTCGAVVAGEAKCHDLTLRKVLPGSRDAVLLLEVRDGQIGQCAVKIPDQPGTDNRVAATITLNASLDGKGMAGRYSGVFGAEKQRQGEVSVVPGSASELRKISAPVVSPQTPWRAFPVHVDGVKGAVTPQPGQVGNDVVHAPIITTGVGGSGKRGSTSRGVRWSDG